MQMLLRLGAAALAACVAAPLLAQAPARRALEATDLYRVRDVRDPQRSPDGQWVAYTVTTADSATDKNNTDVWMVSWDGTQNLRLTSTPESENRPRWSPDGRHLAFVSARQGASGGQLWLLDRRGGEAVKLTDVKGGVSDYAWSPDAKRLVLVVAGDSAEAAADTAKNKTPRPIVVDRYHFKQDGDGYLGARHRRLYLFDVATKQVDTLTSGRFDDESPVWSPDGTQIAFVSERAAADPDRANNTDVFVVEARRGAKPRQLTTHPGPDGSPAWSPDGRWVAYLQGSRPEHMAYNQNRLAVVPAAGGAARVLTEALDRPVASPAWQADGSAVVVSVTDDRARYLARVPAAAGGALQPLTQGRRVVSAPSLGRDGHAAVLAASAAELPEVFALEDGRLRPLSRQNDSLLAVLRPGITEDVEFASADGTRVHALLVKPAGFQAGRKYPLLLRVHGGPNAQDQHEFNFERELFAAHGYLVLAVNYRGSTGRGEAYQTAIYGDWGNKEVADLLAGVDHLVRLGLADSTRLGIGGWSYGGILTNYTIASTPRFKAAVSGAGSSLQLSMYGSDQYTLQYDTELGPPWKNPEPWIRVSYPFFHADRIRTPTLFMVGERDFNVPAAGSEQMYQALRSLEVPTQLVIYPSQYHGLTIPSYRVDRLRRHLEWYARYLTR